MDQMPEFYCKAVLHWDAGDSHMDFPVMRIDLRAAHLFFLHLLATIISITIRDRAY